MRDWSFAAPLDGRTPGMRITNFGPQARRTARASCAEQTTPSSPAPFASRASATARDSIVPGIPISCNVAASKLVNTVTPSSFGRFFLSPAASRAACITAVPDEACSVNRCTWGSLTAAATAFATVFGMSWNFRSRKILAPVSASFSTARGPSEVKSWLPTLKSPTAPRSFRVKAVASPSRSTSRATISRRDESVPGVAAP
jgi:hypothetical protein